MEEDLKILKVEYTQILNFCLDDRHTYKSLKWRWPAMEDTLKVLKVEYLSKRLLDHTQILNLS